MAWSEAARKAALEARRRRAGSGVSLARGSRASHSWDPNSPSVTGNFSKAETDAAQARMDRVNARRQKTIEAFKKSNPEAYAKWKKQKGAIARATTRLRKKTTGH